MEWLRVDSLYGNRVTHWTVFHDRNPIFPLFLISESMKSIDENRNSNTIEIVRLPLTTWELTIFDGSSLQKH